MSHLLWVRRGGRHVHRTKPAWWWGPKRRAAWHHAEDELVQRLADAFWKGLRTR